MSIQFSVPNITQPEQDMHDSFLPTFERLSGRIGIFGGTFDPLTNAHLSAANKAREELKLDMVVFIPTAQNPLKTNQPMFTEEKRLKFIKDALDNQTDCYVSPIEVDSGVTSYTVDTLRNIRRDISEDAQLFLLMGADCLKEMHLWRDYKSIFELATVVPFSRDGFTQPEIDHLPHLTPSERAVIKPNFIPMSNMLSASQIRSALEQGVLLDDELPDNVAQSIREWWPERFSPVPNSFKGKNVTEMARGNFLRLVKDGRWEYVSRVNCSGVVTVLPLTEKNEVILVKQFRIPIGRDTLEFPSGLVGDEIGHVNEEVISAGERELFEETGYGDGEFHYLGEACASAGLSDEVISYVLAINLKKLGDGGGVGNEKISVVTIPLDEVDSFIEESRANGIMIDRKLAGGLRDLERYMANKRVTERFSPILNRIVNICPEKFHGSVLGTALGDAIGLPLETMSTDAISKEYGRVVTFLDPSKNNWIRSSRLGTTSDDTALTIALLKAFSLTGEYDRDSVALFHIKALTESSEGWGKSSIEGVRRIQGGGPWDGREDPKRVGLGTGNGVAMKISPVAMHAVMKEKNREEFVSIVKDIAILTHPTGLGVASGLAQAAGVYYCLTNNSTNMNESNFNRDEFVDFISQFAEEALRDFPNDKETVEFIAKLRSLKEVWRETGDQIGVRFGGGDCYALNSVPFAMSYFLKNPTSVESIFNVINAGGDTDSNGAIVGALVGALMGEKVMPEQLIKEISEVNKISVLTKNFCAK